MFLRKKIFFNYWVPANVFVTLFSCILTFIINPGIIYSDKKSNEKIYCRECQFLYPKSNIKMDHYFTCRICVCNYDHHCDVIGKCIGKYNTALFLLFVLSTFSFIFSFASVLFNLLQLK